MKLAEWLEARLQGAPPELAGAIRDLVRDEATQGAIPDQLAAAALRGFSDVLVETTSDRRSRRAALRLLAADASLTYAFEAAADLELDVVGLADRIGPLGALGSLLACPAPTASPASPAPACCDPGGPAPDERGGPERSPGARS